MSNLNSMQGDKDDGQHGLDPQNVVGGLLPVHGVHATQLAHTPTASQAARPHQASSLLHGSAGPSPEPHLHTTGGGYVDHSTGPARANSAGVPASSLPNPSRQRHSSSGPHQAKSYVQDEPSRGRASGSHESQALTRNTPPPQGAWVHPALRTGFAGMPAKGHTPSPGPAHRSIPASPLTMQGSSNAGQARDDAAFVATWKLKKLNVHGLWGGLTTPPASPQPTSLAALPPATSPYDASGRQAHPAWAPSPTARHRHALSPPAHTPSHGIPQAMPNANRLSGPTHSGGLSGPTRRASGTNVSAARDSRQPASGAAQGLIMNSSRTPATSIGDGGGGGGGGTSELRAVSPQPPSQAQPQTPTGTTQPEQKIAQPMADAGAMQRLQQQEATASTAHVLLPPPATCPGHQVQAVEAALGVQGRQSMLVDAAVTVRASAHSAPPAVAAGQVDAGPVPPTSTNQTQAVPALPGVIPALTPPEPTATQADGSQGTQRPTRAGLHTRDDELAAATLVSTHTEPQAIPVPELTAADTGTGAVDISGVTGAAPDAANPGAVRDATGAAQAAQTSAVHQEADLVQGTAQPVQGLIPCSPSTTQPDAATLCVDHDSGLQMNADVVNTQQEVGPSACWAAAVSSDPASSTREVCHVADTPLLSAPHLTITVLSGDQQEQGQQVDEHQETELQEQQQEQEQEQQQEQQQEQHVVVVVQQACHILSGVTPLCSTEPAWNQHGAGWMMEEPGCQQAGADFHAQWATANMKRDDRQHPSAGPAPATQAALAGPVDEQVSGDLMSGSAEQELEQEADDEQQVVKQVVKQEEQQGMQVEAEEQLKQPQSQCVISTAAPAAAADDDDAELQGVADPSLVPQTAELQHDSEPLQWVNTLLCLQADAGIDRAMRLPGLGTRDLGVLCEAELVRCAARAVQAVAAPVNTLDVNTLDASRGVYRRSVVTDQDAVTDAEHTTACATQPLLLLHHHEALHPLSASVLSPPPPVTSPAALGLLTAAPPPVPPPEPPPEPPAAASVLIKVEPVTPSAGQAPGVMMAQDAQECGPAPVAILALLRSVLDAPQQRGFVGEETAQQLTLDEPQQTVSASAALMSEEHMQRTDTAAEGEGAGEVGTGQADQVAQHTSLEGEALVLGAMTVDGAVPIELPPLQQQEEEQEEEQEPSSNSAGESGGGLRSSACPSSLPLTQTISSCSDNTASLASTEVQQQQHDDDDGVDSAREGACSEQVSAPLPGCLPLTAGAHGYQAATKALSDDAVFGQAGAASPGSVPQTVADMDRPFLTVGDGASEVVEAQDMACVCVGYEAPAEADDEQLGCAGYPDAYLSSEVDLAVSMVPDSRDASREHVMPYSSQPQCAQQHEVHAPWQALQLHQHAPVTGALANHLSSQDVAEWVQQLSPQEMAGLLITHVSRLLAAAQVWQETAPDPTQAAYHHQHLLMLPASQPTHPDHLSAGDEVLEGQEQEQEQLDVRVSPGAHTCTQHVHHTERELSSRLLRPGQSSHSHLIVNNNSQVQVSDEQGCEEHAAEGLVQLQHRVQGVLPAQLTLASDVTVPLAPLPLGRVPSAPVQPQSPEALPSGPSIADAEEARRVHTVDAAGGRFTASVGMQGSAGEVLRDGPSQLSPRTSPTASVPVQGGVYGEANDEQGWEEAQLPAYSDEEEEEAVRMQWLSRTSLSDAHQRSTQRPAPHPVPCAWPAQPCSYVERVMGESRSTAGGGGARHVMSGGVEVVVKQEAEAEAHSVGVGVDMRAAHQVTGAGGGAGAGLHNARTDQQEDALLLLPWLPSCLKPSKVRPPCVTLDMPSLRAAIWAGHCLSPDERDAYLLFRQQEREQEREQEAERHGGAGSGLEVGARGQYKAVPPQQAPHMRHHQAASQLKRHRQQKHRLQQDVQVQVHETRQAQLSSRAHAVLTGACRGKPGQVLGAGAGAGVAVPGAVRQAGSKHARSQPGHDEDDADELLLSDESADDEDEAHVVRRSRKRKGVYVGEEEELGQEEEEEEGELGEELEEEQGREQAEEQEEEEDDKQYGEEELEEAQLGQEQEQQLGEDEQEEDEQGDAGTCSDHVVTDDRLYPGRAAKRQRLHHHHQDNQHQQQQQVPDSLTPGARDRADTAAARGVWRPAVPPSLLRFTRQPAGGLLRCLNQQGQQQKPGIHEAAHEQAQGLGPGQQGYAAAVMSDQEVQEERGEEQQQQEEQEEQEEVAEEVDKVDEGMLDTRHGELGTAAAPAAPSRQRTDQCQKARRLSSRDTRAASDQHPQYTITASPPLHVHEPAAAQAGQQQHPASPVQGSPLVQGVAAAHTPTTAHQHRTPPSTAHMPDIHASPTHRTAHVPGPAAHVLGSDARVASRDHTPGDAGAASPGMPSLARLSRFLVSLCSRLQQQFESEVLQEPLPSHLIPSFDPGSVGAAAGSSGWDAGGRGSGTGTGTASINTIDTQPLPPLPRLPKPVPMLKSPSVPDASASAQPYSGGSMHPASGGSASVLQSAGPARGIESIAGQQAALEVHAAGARVGPSLHAMPMDVDEHLTELGSVSKPAAGLGRAVSGSGGGAVGASATAAAMRGVLTASRAALVSSIVRSMFEMSDEAVEEEEEEEKGEETVQEDELMHTPAAAQQAGASRLTAGNSRACAEAAAHRQAGLSSAVSEDHAGDQGVEQEQQVQEVCSEAALQAEEARQRCKQLFASVLRDPTSLAVQNDADGAAPAQHAQHAAWPLEGAALPGSTTLDEPFSFHRNSTSTGVQSPTANQPPQSPGSYLMSPTRSRLLQQLAQDDDEDVQRFLSPRGKPSARSAGTNRQPTSINITRPSSTAHHTNANDLQPPIQSTHALPPVTAQPVMPGLRHSMPSTGQHTPDLAGQPPLPRETIAAGASSSSVLSALQAALQCVLPSQRQRSAPGQHQQAVPSASGRLQQLSEGDKTHVMTLVYALLQGEEQLSEQLLQSLVNNRQSLQEQEQEQHEEQVEEVQEQLEGESEEESGDDQAGLRAADDLEHHLGHTAVAAGRSRLEQSPAGVAQFNCTGVQPSYQQTPLQQQQQQQQLHQHQQLVSAPVPPCVVLCAGTTSAQPPPPAAESHVTNPSHVPRGDAADVVHHTAASNAITHHVAHVLTTGPHVTPPMTLMEHVMHVSPEARAAADTPVPGQAVGLHAHSAQAVGSRSAAQPGEYKQPGEQWRQAHASGQAAGSVQAQVDRQQQGCALTRHCPSMRLQRPQLPGGQRTAPVATAAGTQPLDSQEEAERLFNDMFNQYPVSAESGRAVAHPLPSPTLLPYMPPDQQPVPQLTAPSQHLPSSRAARSPGPSADNNLTPPTASVSPAPPVNTAAAAAAVAPDSSRRHTSAVQQQPQRPTTQHTAHAEHPCSAPPPPPTSLPAPAPPASSPSDFSQSGVEAAMAMVTAFLATATPTATATTIAATTAAAATAATAVKGAHEITTARGGGVQGGSLPGRAPAQVRHAPPASSPAPPTPPSSSTALPAPAIPPPPPPPLGGAAANLSSATATVSAPALKQLQQHNTNTVAATQVTRPGLTPPGGTAPASGLPALSPPPSRPAAAHPGDGGTAEADEAAPLPRCVVLPRASPREPPAHHHLLTQTREDVVLEQHSPMVQAVPAIQPSYAAAAAAATAELPCQSWMVASDSGASDDGGPAAPEAPRPRSSRDPRLAGPSKADRSSTRDAGRPAAGASPPVLGQGQVQRQHQGQHQGQEQRGTEHVSEAVSPSGYVHPVPPQQLDLGRTQAEQTGSVAKPIRLAAEATLRPAEQQLLPPAQPLQPAAHQLLPLCTNHLNRHNQHQQQQPGRAGSVETRGRGGGSGGGSLVGSMSQSRARDSVSLGGWGTSDLMKGTRASAGGSITLGFTNLRPSNTTTTTTSGASVSLNSHTFLPVSGASTAAARKRKPAVRAVHQPVPDITFHPQPSFRSTLMGPPAAKRPRVLDAGSSGALTGPSRLLIPALLPKLAPGRAAGMARSHVGNSSTQKTRVASGCQTQKHRKGGSSGSGSGGSQQAGRASHGPARQLLPGVASSQGGLTASRGEGGLISSSTRLQALAIGSTVNRRLGSDAAPATDEYAFPDPDTGPGSDLSPGRLQGSQATDAANEDVNVLSLFDGMLS